MTNTQRIVYAGRKCYPGNFNMMPWPSARESNLKNQIMIMADSMTPALPKVQRLQPS